MSAALSTLPAPSPWEDSVTLDHGEDLLSALEDVARDYAVMENDLVLAIFWRRRHDGTREGVLSLGRSEVAAGRERTIVDALKELHETLTTRVREGRS